MSYHQERKEIFAEIFISAVTAKHPNFEIEVARSAWNIQEKSSARRKVPLSLDKRFFIYVFLDPRKPGRYVYDLPGGKKLIFNHEPFYVGKGVKDRPSQHFKNCKVHLQSPKNAKIKKIRDAGFEVIVKTITKASIDAVALAKEIMLIQAVGRKPNGPLTNLCDGGEGPSGTRHTEATKHKWRMAKLGKAQSMEANHKRSATLKGRVKSPEHLAKIQAARSNQPEMTCPHCSKVGRASGMKTWHFDNCKLKV